METIFTWIMVIGILCLVVMVLGLMGKRQAEIKAKCADFEVVGESRYQEILEQICGGRTPDGAHHNCEATLRRNGQRVDVEVGGKKVGLLSHDSTDDFIKLGQMVIQCPAQIRGGWDRGPEDRGSFGVFLKK